MCAYIIEIYNSVHLCDGVLFNNQGCFVYVHCSCNWNCGGNFAVCVVCGGSPCCADALEKSTEWER